MPNVIPQELQPFIEGQIASGKYRSEEEVVAVALRQFRERVEKTDALRADLLEGIAELNNGHGLNAEEVFARLRERAAQLKEQL